MTSQVPQNALIVPTGIPIANQTIPAEKPACIPLGPFNFATLASYQINVTLYQQLGRISIVQGLFIDNAANTSTLIVSCNVSGQSVTCPPLCQGYFPVLAVNPFSFTVTSGGSVNTNNAIYIYNVPIAPAIWSVSAGGALITQPVSDTILDAIVSGGKALVNVKSTYTPLGYQQITSLSAAAALTVPGGATFAWIGAESQALRWRDDGTNPTASVGIELAVGTYFWYDGNLAAIKFIEETASGKLNVSYYS